MVIFIPEWFLTRAIKCVDPSRSDTLLDYSKELMKQTNLCPERRKYFEDLKLLNFYAGGQHVYRREIAKKNLYIALQAYFKGKD